MSVDLQAKYFSAGFFPNETSFRISNISTDKKSDLPKSVFILEKMLLRGLPTKPSTFLSNAFKKFFPKESYEQKNTPYFISNNKPFWDLTILGDPDNKDNNPAKKFFNSLLPDYLGEYAFVTYLIQPECNFSNFLANKIEGEDFSNELRCDFFLDIADLVIEIDGIQHKQTKLSDEQRDELLNKRGIETIRISTEEIKTLNETFKEKIQQIIRKIKESELIQHYKAAFEKKSYLEEKYEFTLTAIVRLQLTILELIKSGDLDIRAQNWELNISSDVNSSFNWASVAIDDFFEWLLPIAAIYSENISKPETKISLGQTKEEKKKHSVPNTVNIDLRLFDRWDEKTFRNLVVVRSDYINHERYTVVNHKQRSFSASKEIRDNARLDYQLQEFGQISENLEVEKALEKFNYQLFGFEKFKDGQIEIITQILESKQTLGLLPTGGGKSLCFHLTASLYQGTCIIFCPIIALMKDQVAELSLMGFTNRITEISSQQTPEQQRQVMNKINRGKMHFVFVSPERVQRREFRNLLNGLNVGTVVVDEAHCLSEWGHDFRLPYLTLAPSIKKFMPGTPIICLTATASLPVLRDIQAEFELTDDEVVYKMDNSREELGFNVLSPAYRGEVDFNVRNLAEEKEPALNNLISELQTKGWVSEEAAGIIFTPHVNGKLSCYNVQRQLSSTFTDLKTGLFSGDKPRDYIPVDEDTKKKFGSHPANETFTKIKFAYQERFKKNELAVMCVTKSFGMGINKPNIRFTVHYAMPTSMEALYQEGGRAGRDGKNAECYVLFTKSEVDIPEWIHHESTDVKQIKKWMEENSWTGGDFTTQLFLTVASLNKIEDDLFICKKVLETIEDKAPMACEVVRSKYDFKEIEFDENKKKTNVSINIQKAIYRLYILGLVEDWTVEGYGRNEAYRVYTTKIKNVSDMAKSLLGYISRYEKNKVNRKINEREIADILNRFQEKQVKLELVRFLLNWNYKNFVNNRRQSLKNLYEACMGYEPSKKQAFKEKLDSYFRIDQLTLDIGRLIEASPKEAVKLIKKRLIQNKKLVKRRVIEKIKSALSRFLESERSNPSLDLFSGIIRLISDDFNDADGKPRLQNFIKISQEDGENWHSTFKKLCNFINKLDPTYREQFSSSVGNLLEKNSDIIMLHEMLKDDSSAVIYLNRYNKKLRKMVG